MSVTCTPPEARSSLDTCLMVCRSVTSSIETMALAADSSVALTEKVLSVQNTTNKALAVQVDDSSAATPFRLRWACGVATAASEVALAALRKAVKGPFPKLYDAVTGLLRTSVENLLDLLDNVEVASTLPVAATLLPLCCESATDFAVTNLSFKATTRLLTRAAEDPTAGAGAELAELVGAFVRLLLARLEQATEEAVLAAEDVSQAAEKRFSRVSRIVRFYLNHLASMAKAYAGTVATVWEKLLSLSVSVKSLTVAAFLPRKPQAQQEVAGCLAASLTAVWGPLSGSEAVPPDAKAGWLRHLADPKDDHSPNARQACGNALLLAELLSLNCWGLFRAGHGDALLETVLPSLLFVVDQPPGRKPTDTSNHILFSRVGSDTPQSVYQCLRGQLCHVVLAVPAPHLPALQRLLYRALSCSGLAGTLLAGDLWAFAFRVASDDWRLRQLETLLQLVGHVGGLQVTVGRALPHGGAEAYSPLLRALRHTLRGLPDCGAAAMQAIVPTLQRNLEEADCSQLAATLQCLPAWALKQLHTGFPQVWAAALEKSAAQCNVFVAGPQPDWPRLAQALGVARRCLHRTRLVPAGPARPTAPDAADGGCLGCFGQRTPPALHAAEEGCGCLVVRLDPGSMEEGILQRLLTAVGNVMVRVDVSQPPPPPATSTEVEEVVGLCLEVCGALLPIVKPPVLIKLLSRAVTEYCGHPLLTVALDDLLCRCAFVRFPAALDAFPDQQREATLSLLAQLWRHQLQRDANAGPAEWLALHHALAAFEAFAKVTEFPYDRMVEGETKKAVVRYLTNQVPESSVPLTLQEEAWFADAVQAQTARQQECIQVLEAMAKRPRTEESASKELRAPKRFHAAPHAPDLVAPNPEAHAPTSAVQAAPSVANILLDTVAEQLGRLEDHLHAGPRPDPDALDRLATLRARLAALERHVRAQLRVP
eukprot:EG_transcript_1822